MKPSRFLGKYAERTCCCCGPLCKKIKFAFRHLKHNKSMDFPQSHNRTMVLPDEPIGRLRYSHVVYNPVVGAVLCNPIRGGLQMGQGFVDEVRAVASLRLPDVRTVAVRSQTKDKNMT